MNHEELFRQLFANQVAIGQKLDAVLATLQSGISAMSQQLDNLAKQVEALTTVNASAVALIQGMATQIAASANDPAKIDALAAQLHASAEAMAKAIEANTSPPATTPAA